jgi:hypothetical protein
MSRVIAVTACGFTLAACSMSMPSLDFFRSTPPMETLRIESEPPGADARTTAGQNCRTPCELVIPAGGELVVTFTLNGFQPMSVPVRAESPAGVTYGEPAGPPRLQPNPVYAELQPLVPLRPAKKKGPAKRRPVAAKKPGPPSEVSVPDPAAAYPAGYPWPPPPPN